MTDSNPRLPLANRRHWFPQSMLRSAGMAICLVIAGNRCEVGPHRLEAQYGVPKKSTPRVSSDSVQKTAEQREAAIRRALGETITVDFEHVPLEQAVRDLARKLSVPVEFDREAIKQQGVSLETQVALHVPKITPRSALRLLFDEESLGCLITNEMLLVTTSQKSLHTLETRLYDVTDLVLNRDASAPRREDLTSLEHVITVCCSPDSWDILSGPGSIMGIPYARVQVLAVRQSQAVHDEVAAFLADLRKARRDPGDTKKRDVQVRADQSPGALREAAIRAALDKSVSVAADQQPLVDVLTDLARQIDVPLWINAKRLPEEQIAVDTPVTFQSTDISARSALSVILGRLNLGWSIRHEVLVITTHQDSMSWMAAHVYDVSDIVTRFRDERGKITYDFTSLMNAITTTVEPNSEWGNGAGVIVPYRQGGILALTFPQEEYVHEAVDKFLIELRDLRRASDPDNEPLPYEATKRDRE